MTFDCVNVVIYGLFSYGFNKVLNIYRTSRNTDFLLLFILIIILIIYLFICPITYLYLYVYLYIYLYIYLLTYFTQHSGRDIKWHKRNRHDLVNPICNTKVKILIIINVVILYKCHYIVCMSPAKHTVDVNWSVH